MSEKNLLDVTTASKRLGLQKQTLYTWINQRRGPAFCRIGRRVMFRPEDLDSFINECRVVPKEYEAA